MRPETRLHQIVTYVTDNKVSGLMFGVATNPYENIGLGLPVKGLKYIGNNEPADLWEADELTKGIDTVRATLNESGLSLMFKNSVDEINYTG